MDRFENILVLFGKFIGVLILLAIFLLLGSLLVKEDESALIGIVGIVGVIIGALITASSNVFVAFAQRRFQFRLVAVEKRLQAHQEAFALWAKLCANLTKTSEFDKVYSECQEWWYHNCLYLEDQVRKAFRDCYIDALQFSRLAETGGNYKDRRDLFVRIESLGNSIFGSINLPSLQSLEDEKLSDIWTSGVKKPNG